MKACELCEGMARIHCESDQGSLCWDCDAMVHSANFLVARHSRNLLCHVCQSPTPWSASGSKLGPTVALCQRCLNEGISAEAETVKEEAEEIEENQVVPGSPPPPPSSESSSSIGEEPAVTYEPSDERREYPSSHFNIRIPPPYMAEENAVIVDLHSEIITTLQQ